MGKFLPEKVKEKIREQALKKRKFIGIVFGIYLFTKSLRSILKNKRRVKSIFILKYRSLIRSILKISSFLTGIYLAWVLSKYSIEFLIKFSYVLQKKLLLLMEQFKRVKPV